MSDGGGEYSRYFHLPRNADDLLKRSELIAASTREGATLVVLIKEIGTDALYALHIVGERMAAAGKPEYRERIAKYHRYCRDNDLAVAVAQTDVKGDRSLGPTRAGPSRLLRARWSRSAPTASWCAAPRSTPPSRPTPMRSSCCRRAR